MATHSTFSVVVVTYQAADLVAACLGSLADAIGEGLEVIVVDNASTDGTADIVRRRWPGVDVTESARNVGFGAGCDIGIARTTRPWVLLLNSDAEVQDGTLTAMARAVVAAPRDVAALTCRVLLADRFVRDSDGPVVDPSTGERFSARPEGDVDLVNSTGNLVRTDGFGVDRGWLRPADDHHPPADVFGFCGAAALLRRAAVDDVGGFDASLFMYYEDTDLSWRLRLRGWRVTYVEDAVVRHRHSATSDETSDFFRFHDQRNRLLVLTADASAVMAVRAVVRYPLSALSLLRGELPHLAPTRLRMRVMAAYLRLLPGALRSRRLNARRATVGRREVERSLVPVAEAPGGSFRR